MTTHELARELLECPDVPVVGYDTEVGYWREVHKVDPVMRQRYVRPDTVIAGVTEVVPIAMLPL